jgi:hypothetical protein
MVSHMSRTIIPKQTVPVVIRTIDQRIEGLMHVLYNHRVTDVLNGVPEVFIPITSVRIHDAKTDTFIEEREFMAINKEHIVYLSEIGPRTDPPQET